MAFDNHMSAYFFGIYLEKQKNMWDARNALFPSRLLKIIKRKRYKEREREIKLKKSFKET